MKYSELSFHSLELFYWILRYSRRGSIILGDDYAFFPFPSEVAHFDLSINSVNPLC